MRLFLLCGAATILGLVLLAACNSQKSPGSQATSASPRPTNGSQNPAPPSDSARRITANELHDLWEKGTVLVVDTRTEPAYKESHIKGAILIPAGEVGGKTDELPRNKMIVTYCT